MSHRNPNRPIDVGNPRPDPTSFENDMAHGQKDYEQGYTTLKRRMRSHNGAWVEVEEARRYENGGDSVYMTPYVTKGY